MLIPYSSHTHFIKHSLMSVGDVKKAWSFVFWPPDGVFIGHSVNVFA
jgi:hypothetical protein